MHRFFMSLALLVALDAPAATPDLVQHAHGRAGISLDGAWARIIDPFENGYYDYRWRPKENGYFIARKAEILKGYVDAVNLTDNQTAVVRLSSSGPLPGTHSSSRTTTSSRPIIPARRTRR